MIKTVSEIKIPQTKLSSKCQYKSELHPNSSNKNIHPVKDKIKTIIITWDNFAYWHFVLRLWLANQLPMLQSIPSCWSMLHWREISTGVSNICLHISSEKTYKINSILYSLGSEWDINWTPIYKFHFKQIMIKTVSEI